MTNLPKGFEVYLRSEAKISGTTLRNYRADLAHFLGWAALHLQSHGVKVEGHDSVLPYFSSQLTANYKGYHIENKIPQGTTNRRLSTLRNFAKFLLHEGLLSQNPTNLVTNIQKTHSPEDEIENLVDSFAKHLKQDGASPVTTKNYVSDVRQFLYWMPESGKG